MGYYQNNYLLVSKCGFSLEAIEALKPIEREIYILIYGQEMKEKQERAQRRKNR